MRKKIALWVSQKRQLPYRLRKSVVKRIYPSILTNYKFEMDFYGLRYAGNTNNSTDRMFFMFGGCKKYMLSMLKDYSIAQRNDDLIFFDVGAYVGNYTLFMSKYAKKIHAFEPSHNVRKSIESNISLNKIKNVIIHATGLSNNNDDADFEVRIGDDIVLEKNIKNVDVIKIDVTGSERKIIEGLAKTIERFRPMVILEISKVTRSNFGSQDDFESVFPEGYNFFLFSGVSREKDSYNLAKFDYDLHHNHLDVIALPKEKQVYLSDRIVSKAKRNKVVGG